PGGVVERRASQRIAGVNRNSGIEEPLRVGNVAGANGGVERFSSGRQRGSLRKRRDQRAREQAQDRDPANHAPSVSPRNRIYRRKTVSVQRFSFGAAADGNRE